MEYHCGNCGGFVGEEGKVYGYAGKWCNCGNRQPPNENTVTYTTISSNPDIEFTEDELALIYSLVGMQVNEIDFEEQPEEFQSRCVSISEKIENLVKKV